MQTQDHYFFFQVTKLEENPWVLPLISRMVPRVNPRIFRAQGRSVNIMNRIHYNNILIINWTCHLRELNLGGEDNNHSSRPPKLNMIDNYASFHFLDKAN